MPKVDPQAILEPSDVNAALKVAKAMGAFEHALFAWMYEFGSRAAEPGLQLVREVDSYGRRARPIHLKRVGKADKPIRGEEWQPLLQACRAALPAWLEARGSRIVDPRQEPYLFLGKRKAGRCYPCHGTGQRPRKTAERELVPCHYCGQSGEQWGISRFEVHAVISSILFQANVPAGRRHPHVLRHSIITHLLDAGISPAAIQHRVGHAHLATTLGYVKLTKKAQAELDGALSGIYERDDPEDDSP